MAINSDTKKLKILNDYLIQLPQFFFDFIQRYIKNTTTLNTKIAYCKDTKTFLEFLQTLPKFTKIADIKNFTIKDISEVTKVDLENYLLYLEDYNKNYISKNGKEINVDIQNENGGKMRKLSSIRCLFGYLFSSELISKDISQLIKMPKINQKIKSILAVDEVVHLLDSIEKGNGLTKKQQSFYNQTKIRDICIITILLGTGIRVSELVNLNLKDINFNEGQLKVTRKGQDEDIIYCNQEVLKAIQDYYAERINNLKVDADNQEAFILSTQNKRINERTVRNMVKKYTEVSGILKNITPHALRRTFGTNIYNETCDVYLVAELLGHKSVETTKKHYAQLNLDRKRKALEDYKLR